MDNIKLIQQKNKEDFTDRLLKRFEEEPGRAKIIALNFTGIVSPLFAVILISVNYVLSHGDAETDKEVNSSIGMWVLSSLLGTLAGLIIFATVSNGSLIKTNSSLIKFAEFIMYSHYAYIFVVFINAIKFLKGRPSVYPTVMTIPLKYTKIINKINQKLI